MLDHDYDPLPFESLLMGEDGTGVLWAINRVLFHPRGFALAIVCGDDGNATGWSLQGDGSDVWTMGDLPEDDAFRTFEKFLDAHRAPLWVAGQVRDEDGYVWELQGIYRTEAEAVAVCKTDRWFVGPEQIGEALPDETQEWPGCRYPLADSGAKGAE